MLSIQVFGPGGHDRNTAPEYFGLMGVAHGPLRRRHSGRGRAVRERAPVDPSSFASVRSTCCHRWLEDGGDGRGWIMNESSQSMRIKNVLSLEVARKRTRPPRGSSSGHVSRSSNQRLIERLEAENTLLRDSVVELLLQIQALRNDAG